MTLQLNPSLGQVLLAIFLILTGLQLLTGLAIPAILMGLLALIAGILILIGR